MGIPTGDGPDLIIHRMKDDAMVSGRRVAAVVVVVLWALLVFAPYLIPENPSSDTLIRWTALASIALLLIFSLPPLISNERRGAVVGIAVAAAAVIVLAWVFTA